MYSDPVDPEEVEFSNFYVKLVHVSSLVLRYLYLWKFVLQLPDYHELIKNPMDFTTLREKLEAGAYSTLEQFEASLVL